MNTNDSLSKARLLNVPSRQAMLQRDASVSHFWNSNRRLLEEAWADWEMLNTGDIPVIDETVIDPGLRKAVNDAWKNPEKEHNVKELWEEVIPGVYTTQFFDIDRLTEFRQYLDAAANAQIPTRPPYGIQLNRYGVMLDPRSEGYLAAPTFQMFYNDLMDRYMRPIARLLLNTYGFDSQTFGFSIQYNSNKDRDLQPHTDASAATLNVNINLPNENFTGSQVDFHDKATRKTIQTVFEPGKAIIHRGNVPHATHPITSGQRRNLVFWLYGNQMQTPGGGASSYGNFNQTMEAKDQREIHAPGERWCVSTIPKDTFAPF